MVIGDGICVENCIPNDPPTPRPPLPCEAACDLILPPSPSCGEIGTAEENFVLDFVQGTGRCDTLQQPNLCVWTADTLNCVVQGKECLNGNCVLPGSCFLYVLPSPLFSLLPFFFCSFSLCCVSSVLLYISSSLSSFSFFLV